MRKRVLLVDDEEDICESLRDALADSGYDVDYATTGEMALEKIAAGVWDMGVIDLKLSTKVTGLDVMEALHEKNPFAIIVACSGYEDISLRQRVEKLGARAFLRKPNDIQYEVFSKKIGALFELYGRKNLS